MSYGDPKTEPSPLKSAMEEACETTSLMGGPNKRVSWTFGLYDFLMKLEKGVGYQLLALLFVVQHILKGFVYEFQYAAVNYIYSEYSLTASQITLYTGVTSLPWSLKPIIGLASDLFPIYGYNRAPYMLIYSIAGTAAFAIVGVTSADTLSQTWLVLAFFTQALQMSSCDLLCEAKYAEKIQENTAIGPAMLSYVWGGQTAFALFADMISGPVLAWSPHAVFAICTVPAALVIVPLAMGYTEETKADPIVVAEKRTKFFAQFEVCFLVAIMTVAVLSLTVCGLASSSPKMNAIASLLAFIGTTTGFLVMLSPTLAKFCAYTVLQTSLTLSTSGASYYFFIDTPTQYPEGPHFTPFFYSSVLGTCSSLMALIGIVIFQRYFSHYSYRNIMLVTNVGYGILSLLDCLFYSRINVRLGIPDHVFVLGTACMESMVLMWQYMPQVIILSYFCPKGMEATMYALLAGLHNLGSSISSTWGAYLLELLHVEPSGAVDESSEFDNLWVASLISSLLPTITVAALFFLVPDVKQGDAVVNPDASVVEGSLWRRWRSED